MCGWIQLMSEHTSAHYSETFQDMGERTIAASLNTLIDNVAQPSCESLSITSSAISIAHARNPMNTYCGVGSAHSFMRLC